jgi:hypothetical protein
MEEDKNKENLAWEEIKKSGGTAHTYLKPILSNLLLLINEEKKNTEKKLNDLKKILNAQKGR